MPPSSRRPATVSTPSGGTDRYWDASKRPAQMLVFLLPLVLAYEIFLSTAAPDGGAVLTVEAHRQLLRTFTALGVDPRAGLHAGGPLIVAVLLVWQVLGRQRWRVHASTTGLMALESMLLALPLLAANVVLAQAPALAAAPTDATALGAMSRLSQVSIGIGAGLYEELLFRMVLMAAIHTLLVDLAGASRALGLGLAIAISALAFAGYHDLRDPGGGISWRRAIFYLVAGLYFGAVYAGRGFGIVAGCHAAYDIVTVMLSPSEG